MDSKTDITFRHHVTLLQNVLWRTRYWHRREQCDCGLHPAIALLIDKGMRPVDWHLLVLEWPHLSEDGKRLAFTKDGRAGEANRQVVTTPGKYIKRHWPWLPDHDLRDIVGAATGGMSLLDTAEGIVLAVEEGPRSCMKWELGMDEAMRSHPYLAYAPEHGWRMAIRRNEEGRIDGRCLVYVGDAYDDNSKGCFVRSYRRKFTESGNEDYSESDHDLEGWLEHQGYTKESGWPDGAELRYVEADNNPGCLVPYLDGRNDHVSIRYGKVTIDSDGPWEADCTDGDASGGDTEVCNDCNDREDADDGAYVGYSADRWVCSCCADNYVMGRGRNGSEYRFHQDNAVCVDGDHFHEDHLAANGIVELESGDYANEDDAFICPIRDERYHRDDGRHTEDEGTVHEDEAWQCADSGDWYSSNTEPIRIDGETYHEDSDDITQLADGTWALKADAWLCEGSGQWFPDSVEHVEVDGLMYHPEYTPIKEAA